MNSRESWFRGDTQIMKRLLKRFAPLLLMIAGLFDSIIIIEIGLRVFYNKPELERDFYLTGTSCVPDKETIMINPKFLIDSFYTSGDYDKTIVTLGDSVTAGYPVGEGKPYLKILMHLRLSGGRACQARHNNLREGTNKI